MRFGPVRRGALCAVASLSMATLTAAAPSDTAAPGDTTSFTTAGPKIQLQTARGSAPDLRPGVYRSSVPSDETTRYAEVTRRKGETLTVNVSAAPTAAEDGRLTDDDKVSVKLVDPEGDSCVSDSAYRSEGDPVGPLITTLVLDAKEIERSPGFIPDDCLKATSFHLEVTRETEDKSAPPMPLELQVTREPKVSGRPAAAEAVKPVKAPSLSSKTTAVGGHGFSDATTVQDGSERTDLRLGSTVFFKVRVGWSQRLGVSLEVPRNGSSFAPPYDADVSIDLWSPQRLEVGSSYTDGLSNSTMVSKDDGSPSTIGSYTAAVRYANRTAEDPDTGDLDSDAYESASVAGWYYIEVRTVASGDDDPTTSDQAIPARLNVKVAGKATEGPHYVAAGGTEITAPPPGQLSVGGEEDSLPWGRIGGGVAAVLLAVLACLWALRSRRRSA